MPQPNTPDVNADRLVQQSAIGAVSSPVSRGDWRVSGEGIPSILPGVGGISYNCLVGDSAMGWMADHAEPGVSMRNKESKENYALNILACVGNTAVVVSGDAKGDEGVVTGKHGGIDHVLVDFPRETMENLVIGDKIQVRAVGLGLALSDMGIALMNMSPTLFRAMAPRREGRHLHVRVARRLPAHIMGSGIGRSHTFAGDYDTQMFDETIVSEYGLEDLRLGDIVAVENADHTFGRIYRTGAMSIGVVVHSCCKTAGHGPGVTTLMSSRDGLIQAEKDDEANIANLLKIGRMRTELDTEE
jgi:hypothetical protein